MFLTAVAVVGLQLWISYLALLLEKQETNCKEFAYKAILFALDVIVGQ
jgi:hypothetical protein